jgi:hypothetical protein
VSDGRVFLVTSEATYAIGKKAARTVAQVSPPELAPSGASPAWIQVVPAEVLLKPGETVQFHVRSFDAQGRRIGQQQAQFSQERLQGSLSADGKLTAGAGAQAGLVKATVGALSGVARVRVIPPLPFSENFDAVAPGQVPPHWINTAGKYAVRQEESERVLVKLADNPFTKRARSFFGAPDWHDYTIEADVRAASKRRQMGDAGVVAQRYELVLFGNAEKLKIEAWQPNTARSVTIPYAWKADTWYRLKLRVENLADGKVRARGKVWPAVGQEPAEWMIERVDPIGSTSGSAGIYADAPFEVFFDSVKVTSNQ